MEDGRTKDPRSGVPCGRRVKGIASHVTKNTNIRSDNSLSVKRVVDGTSVVKNGSEGWGSYCMTGVAIPLYMNLLCSLVRESRFEWVSRFFPVRACVMIPSVWGFSGRNACDPANEGGNGRHGFS